MQSFEPYTLYITAMGLLILFLSIVLLKRPTNFSRVLLSISLILASSFMILTAFELYVQDFNAMLWLRNFQQIALFLCPVFLFGFARELADSNPQKNIRYMVYLSIPAVLGLILIFTNSFHQWIRSETSVQTINGLTEITVTSTSIGMFFVAYLIFLTLLPVFTLLRNMHDLPTHLRLSHLLSSTAILLPLLSVLIMPFVSIDIPGQVALSFSLMSFMLIFIFKRYDFNSIWPVSRSKILTSLAEGILLFDTQYKLLEINKAGLQIIQKWLPDSNEKMIIGQQAEKIFNNEKIKKSLYAKKTTSFEWKVMVEDASCFLHVNVVPIGYFGQELMLIVFTDITEKKLIENRLYTLAHYDTLTDICNRHSFIEKYNRKIKNKNFPMSLLLLDIDHFKQFNDQYGHLIGDKVLKQFAKTLTKFFITKEQHVVVGRIGGEEFAVLLEMDADAATIQANQFQQKLSECSINVNDYKYENITVSIGVATTYQQTNFETIYKEADDGLYQAKRAGRDRVEMVNT
ncbi:histidine kinase N-terminal 7TM domain-containing diguanylate cyclase [Gracilibacillus massiliensis]|uniref:histidine kinase N-terminal 7TM domain-containing diguanylate cyclase n=1 Tax=Gracilibacillus massiliensis TaxID=1564956 RepID=UPI00071C30B4|nr:diguanylate cyclase [Gracilibacillus massiliensis]